MLSTGVAANSCFQSATASMHLTVEMLCIMKSCCRREWGCPMWWIHFLCCDIFSRWVVFKREGHEWGKQRTTTLEITVCSRYDKDPSLFKVPFTNDTCSMNSLTFQAAANKMAIRLFPPPLPTAKSYMYKCELRICEHAPSCPAGNLFLVNPVQKWMGWGDMLQADCAMNITSARWQARTEVTSM